MKKKLLSHAISVSLLTITAANISFAEDILGGQLSALGSANHPQAIDVFRTTCFSWGDGVHATYAQAVSSGFWGSSGPAAGFRFAVNLQNTSTGTNRSVTATVGFTGGGNVDNSGCSGSGSLSNCLPYDPATNAPQFASVTDNSVGPAWSQTGGQPDFSTNGTSPSGWSTAGWVAGGNGEYVIIIQNSSTNTSATANYDFFGQCQNTSIGTTSLIHTGQGTWFFDNGYGLLTPSAHYDQVINETW